MLHGVRSRMLRGIGAAALAAAATVLFPVATPTAFAEPGPQTEPTLTVDPVQNPDDVWGFDNSTQPTGAFICGGTGGDGYRGQTFIVNEGVDIATLPFNAGFPPDQVGADQDASDGSIAAPLWYNGAPQTGFLPNTSPLGQLDPGLLGSLDFADPSWNLVDGTYQIGIACIDTTLPALTPQEYWVTTVTIDADGEPGSFMTVAADVQATTVSVTANPTESTVGDEVTFTAAVAPSNAAGTVEFSVDGASQFTADVSDGTATWVTSALTAGTKQVTASFTPTDPSAFGPSTSTPVPYTVAGPAAETTTLTLAADPENEADEGDPVTLTATVSPVDAAGTVTFSIDGIIVVGDPVAVESGVAAVTTSQLPPGDMAISAVFTPTDAEAFSGSSDTVDYHVVDVGEETSITLVADPSESVTAGEDVTLTATVEPADAPGAVLFLGVSASEGTVTFQIPDPVEVVEGSAGTTLSSLPVGEHSMQAIFVPTDPLAYQEATSPEVLLSVVAATNPGANPGAGPGSNPEVGSGATPGVVGNSGVSGLATTGSGLRLAAAGFALIYVGRAIYLLFRPDLEPRP